MADAAEEQRQSAGNAHTCGCSQNGAHALARPAVQDVDGSRQNDHSGQCAGRDAVPARIKQRQIEEDDADEGKGKGVDRSRTLPAAYGEKADQEQRQQSPQHAGSVIVVHRPADDAVASLLYQRDDLRTFLTESSALIAVGVAEFYLLALPCAAGQAGPHQLGAVEGKAIRIVLKNGRYGRFYIVVCCLCSDLRP